MRTLDEMKETLAKHKQELNARFKIKEIGIFGSYVRGEQREGSDVDILVEFEEPIGLEFVELAYFLEEILGVKVDLVSKGGIKLKMWKYVEEDLTYV